MKNSFEFFSKVFVAILAIFMPVIRNGDLNKVNSIGEKHREHLGRIDCEYAILLKVQGFSGLKVSSGTWINSSPIGYISLHLYTQQKLDIFGLFLGLIDVLVLPAIGVDLIFEEYYGWTHTYELYGGIDTIPGSGFYLAASTTYYDAGFYRLWALRINLSGTTVWDFHYSSSNGCNAWSTGFSVVYVPSDESCVILGSGVQDCTDGNSGAVIVIKLSSTGTFVWKYEHTNDNAPYNIRLCSNGDFLVALVSSVLRISSSGVLLWEQPLSTIYSAIELSDNTIAVTGYLSVIDKGTEFLYKRYSSEGGYLTETFNYGGIDNDVAWDIMQLTDGNIAIVGHTYNYGTYPTMNGGLLIIQPDGTELYFYAYSGPGNEEFKFLKQQPSSNILYLSGESGSNKNYKHFWLIVVEYPMGALIAEEFFGDDLHTYQNYGITFFNGGQDVAITGYIIGGEDKLAVFAFEGFSSSCNAGEYYSLSTSTCYPCTAGTYQDTAGGYTCFSCESGEYSGEGAISCTVCTPGHYQPNGDKITPCEICPEGTYQTSGSSTSCIICSAGTYQPSNDKISPCLDCDTGAYQNLPSKTSCITCLPGHYQPGDDKVTPCEACGQGEYQNESGKITCIQCLPGFHQPLIGQAECVPCPEGEYSSSPGATVCQVCDPSWYPNVEKTECLFKGIFASEAAFTSSAFNTACFESSNLITPYSMTCRSAYHPHCCQGSQPLPDVSCNYALEALNPGNPMHENYCSACPFLDRSACPTDGLCWNDAAWTDSGVNPYPVSFSASCISAACLYCAPKLRQNLDDRECELFKELCVTLIISSVYNSAGNKFVITFSRDIISVPSDCSAIFDPANTPNLNTGTIVCTKTAYNTLEVDVSGLNKPITRYYFSEHEFSLSIVEFGIHQISAPSPPLETVTISGQIDNKCKDFDIQSSIQVLKNSLTNRNCIHGR